MHTYQSEFNWPKGLCTSTHPRKPYRRGAGLLVAASLSCCLLASVPAYASYLSVQSIDPLPGGSNGQLSPLLQGSDGLLYGMSSVGGTSNLGTIFGLGSNGASYTGILCFTLTNGSTPLGRLLEGAEGSLYGTTAAGGANSSGTVFKISKDGGSFIVLHDFGSISGDGSTPYNGLVKGSDGDRKSTRLN